MWFTAAVLTIVFVVLKLCEVIAWSWWWVFSPLMAMCVIAAVAGMLFFNMVSNSGKHNFK